MTDPRQLYSDAIDALNRGDWRLAQQLATRVALHAPSNGGVHFVADVADLELQMPLALESVHCEAKRRELRTLLEDGGIAVG